ncbi:MAG TPA: glycosyltransferase family 2 protein [Nitrospiria bacterium]|jgi:glycosyltransferase involved in cell wall biosynthesis|nr:glycosyltransferase family 2 protein [Nitrospiria bacterium]
MSDRPVLSIITPSLNQGRFLEETILSIQNQDYAPIEHIIIDGGSTDGSVDLLRRFEGRYNMRWVSEPDGGQADAIRKGFRLAKGELLCWLNADDVYVSRKTASRAAGFFHEYPSVDVVTGGGVYITEEGHWTQLIEASQKRSSFRYLRCMDAILQPATFFKRSVLERVPIDVSLRYAFDWDFFIRLSKQYNLLAVNEIWAGYRVGGYNKTVTGGAARVGELREVTKRYLGKTAWQYWVVAFYYVLYRGIERAPNPYQGYLKTWIKETSRVVSFLCDERITTL